MEKALELTVLCGSSGTAEWTAGTETLLGLQDATLLVMFTHTVRGMGRKRQSKNPFETFQQAMKSRLASTLIPKWLSGGPAAGHRLALPTACLHLTQAGSPGQLIT
ncbi:hypothetical protein SRHO_G00145700 [Serrasalmus rhombeus]